MNYLFPMLKYAIICMVQQGFRRFKIHMKIATRPDETFICPEYSKRAFWTFRKCQQYKYAKAKILQTQKDASYTARMSRSISQLHSRFYPEWRSNTQMIPFRFLILELAMILESPQETKDQLGESRFSAMIHSL